jgi:hypothetical protein
LHTEEERFLARNLQGPSHLLLLFHLHQTFLLAQLGLPPLLSLPAKWRMLQKKVLDHQIAPLKVPRRFILAEKHFRRIQELGKLQSGIRKQKLFSALTICKSRPVTMCHLQWRHSFREPVLLKRYVLPVAPERHGGFVNNPLWGSKVDFCKFFE